VRKPAADSQIGPGEVGPAEFGPTKVRTGNRVFLAPVIPRLDALPQDHEVLLVRRLLRSARGSPAAILAQAAAPFVFRGQDQPGLP
jgi:hypothetical protein